MSARILESFNEMGGKDRKTVGIYITARPVFWAEIYVQSNVTGYDDRRHIMLGTAADAKKFLEIFSFSFYCLTGKPLNAMKATDKAAEFEEEIKEILGG